MQITISPNISKENKEDCLVTACLGETMIIWRHHFHDASMTFCKSSSEIAAVRRVEGQKIMVKQRLGRFWLHTTENFSPQGIGTQRSCPLRFARPTWATPACVILVQIQSWPCLQQEVRDYRVPRCLSTSTMVVLTLQGFQSSLKI